MEQNNKKFILTLDASQISTYLNCPMAWKYAYIENLRVVGGPSESIRKGSLIHTILDSYYSIRAQFPTLSNYDAAAMSLLFTKKVKLCAAAGLSDEFEKFIEKRIYDYVTRYNNDDFRVFKNSKMESSTEVGFSKILFEDEKFLFIVEGRIDLISETNQHEILWVDHKTQERVTNLYNYTPQFLTYAWATGYKYGMINYFGLQKEVQRDTFRRQLIHFPTFMLKRWEEKMLDIFNEIAYTVLNKNEFKFNWDRCAGAFNSNPCVYTHIDELESETLKKNIKAFKYEKVAPWHPY